MLNILHLCLFMKNLNEAYSQCVKLNILIYHARKEGSFYAPITSEIYQLPVTSRFVKYKFMLSAISYQLPAISPL